MSQLRTKLEEVMKKRFFIAPSFSIYGGVAGLYDYGPPGTALQNNIVNYWRSFFVHEEQMLEMDGSIMTPYDVLKTSGHVERFSDYMTMDEKTGDIFRADHLVEAALKKIKEDKKTSDEKKAEIDSILSKLDNFGKEELQNIIKEFGIKSEHGNNLGEVKTFNLMFGADIGPTGYLKGFLRPETAQGQFVNFKRLLDYNNERIPFASASIGKSFRNEISPRSGLLRVREFLMAEIEHFVHPDRKDHPKFDSVKDLVLRFLPADVQSSGRSDISEISLGEAVRTKMVDNQTLGYFLGRVYLFLTNIGIKADRLRFRQHMNNEMAHYACDCWDAEIHTSYGWIECVGNADRACFDLTSHSNVTNEKLVVRERLAEPIEKTFMQLTIDKKAMGMKYRGDARTISTHLEGMDDDALTSLQLKMNSEEGKSVIQAADKEFEIDSDIVKIEKVTKKVHVEEYTPSVIEPSFGLGRIFYALMEHVFWTREGDENRSVLSFSPIIAPVKCLILPLSHDEKFIPFINELKSLLTKKFISCQVDDSSASIGKRYARNDEIGIPFALTVDLDTPKDNTVTIRERDSTSQVRVPISEVPFIIEGLASAQKTWDQVQAEYPAFQ